MVIYNNVIHDTCCTHSEPFFKKQFNFVIKFRLYRNAKRLLCVRYVKSALKTFDYIFSLFF